MSVVVYTAAFGGYDSPKPFPMQTVECETVFITDEPGTQAVGWDLVSIKHPDKGHPRLDAKYFRCHPHELFLDHDISIWIDASFQVHSSTFVEEAISHLGEQNAAFFPHRWRDCIYDEAVASLIEQPQKYRTQPLREQVDHYRKKGMPKHWGLVETGCLIRRHAAMPIILLDKTWWWENLEWSYQDQLSLPYLLWTQKTKFNWLPFNMSQQSWFTIGAHNADN
jgi:hypothetical protein